MHLIMVITTQPCDITWFGIILMVFDNRTNTVPVIDITYFKPLHLSSFNCTVHSLLGGTFVFICYAILLLYFSAATFLDVSLRCLFASHTSTVPQVTFLTFLTKFRIRPVSFSISFLATCFACIGPSFRLCPATMELIQPLGYPATFTMPFFHYRPFCPE